MWLVLVGWGGLVMAFDHQHSVWTEWLARTVDDQGRVDYLVAVADQDRLNRYLAELSAVSPDQYRSWTRNQQLATLLNLFNASTIGLVVRNEPITSIKDIGTLLRGPWEQPAVLWFGRRTTLSALHHQMIVPLFNDDRVAFALSRAAVSSPPLRREAYVADRLDAQLDDQRRRFLADPAFNRIGPDLATWHLSELFQWEAASILRTTADPAAYITHALGMTMPEPPPRIAFRPFNWSLNRQPVAEKEHP
ncbi:MAG TPA: DUF547 domain-containing protein [Kiritimatiellia bacterium]|nr:DUF547 domain-containing protein [Kiritimatiellia bacterium]HMP34541.1 DUF547 domain-containing protein [Kiritimatiellia bacterium]